MPGPGSPASSVDDGPPSPSHAELVKRGSMRSRSKSVVVMEMRMPKPLGKERTLFRLPQVMVAVSGSITPRDLGERAENWFEMFYDLVFVAVCLIMGESQRRARGRLCRLRRLLTSLSPLPSPRTVCLFCVRRRPTALC